MEISQRRRSQPTSAHAFGRTKRPIRPASLVLRIFSNSGVRVQLEFNLKNGVKVKNSV